MPAAAVVASKSNVWSVKSPAKSTNLYQVVPSALNEIPSPLTCPWKLAGSAVSSSLMSTASRVSVTPLRPDKSTCRIASLSVYVPDGARSIRRRPLTTSIRPPLSDE